MRHLSIEIQELPPDGRRTCTVTSSVPYLQSEDLTDLLNHYLTEMSKIALDHGATIDKYVGDAIIAFFGDPEIRMWTCQKMFGSTRTSDGNRRAGMGTKSP